MMQLRRLLISLLQQLRNDLVDDLVSKGANFVLRFRLDGMLY